LWLEAVVVALVTAVAVAVVDLGQVQGFLFPAHTQLL
jgi:hypothetical protein